MAALSISIQRGSAGVKATEYTTGTLAPNAGEIELRMQVLDTNGGKVTRLDVLNALDMFKRQIEAEKPARSRPPSSRRKKRARSNGED